MASLTEMKALPAGVVHQVLGVLATKGTWQGEPTADVLDRLLRVVDPGDALLLPQAVGECLLPLRADEEHLDLALDLIRSFDLFESWRGLLALLRESPNWHAALVAAALSSHPGCSPDLRRVLLRAIDRLPPEPSLERHLRILVEGTLPEGATDLDVAVFAERWPGRAARKHLAKPTPLIVLIEGAGNPHDSLAMCLDIRRASGHVRRLPAGVERPPDGWLPVWVTLMAEGQPPSWYPEKGGTLISGGSLAGSSRRQLLRRLRKLYPGMLRWEPAHASGPTEPLDDPLEDFEVFFDGALRIPEASFLTGWSSTTIRKRGAMHAPLRPRHSLQTAYFSFAQLTALRVESFIAHEMHRRVPDRLAAKIIDMSRSEARVPTHVTVDGTVLFEQEGALVEESGQTLIEGLVGFADIARSFGLGGGGTVPELLFPSDHTRVHPRISHGSPTIRGTRIPATAIRDLMNAGRAAGRRGDPLIESIRSYYPHLSMDQVVDADQVGQLLLV